jgi:hypothetical protein
LLPSSHLVPREAAARGADAACGRAHHARAHARARVERGIAVGRVTNTASHF